MKITKQHERILNTLCQSFQFKNSNDSTTVITRTQCTKPTKTIKRLKDEILLLYPKAYTKKLVSGAVGDKANITVLRQILHAHQKKLLSHRTFAWDAKKKKSVAHYTYKILAWQYHLQRPLDAIEITYEGAFETILIGWYLIYFLVRDFFAWFKLSYLL